MSHTHDDLPTNPSANPHLADVVDARLQDAGRRGLLRGGLGLSAMGFLGGATGLLAGCGSSDDSPSNAVAGVTQTAPPTRPASLGFAALTKSLSHTV
ncbi:MAG: hypothetical protein WCK28_03905, partial [Burkholderiales bacterium]